MYDIVEDELERLKELLEDGEFENEKSNNFVITDDYESDYSHNKIEKLQTVFLDKASMFLEDNYPGKYAIKFGVWCIHIATIEFLNSRGITNWKAC